jgi:hypothetical protein
MLKDGSYLHSLEKMMLRQDAFNREGLRSCHHRLELHLFDVALRLH